jgi:hypothetical protein
LVPLAEAEGAAEEAWRLKALWGPAKAVEATTSEKRIENFMVVNYSE